MRYIFPFLVKYAVRRFEKKVNEQMSQQGRANSEFSEAYDDGNLSVKKPPKQGQKKDKDFEGGEYVDFEEVE